MTRLLCSRIAARLGAISIGAAALIALPANAGQLGAPAVELTATLSQSVLAPDQSHTAHVRIGLKGLPTAASAARAPMNIAIVIDRSGSMAGPRIVAARNAGALAIDRLTPRDIVSVVSYDDRVEVDVPATKATDPAALKARIAALTPRGSTAIWAGLQKGAEEIRKFKSADRVNKIILLSDGLANVGPTHANDFVRLGRQLAQEGITVSTVGLGTGYNEDLMAGLARSAEGTHKFVAEPADLVQFFAREFDDAQNVVAQDVIIHIDLPPGIVPKRGLGRTAEINGQRMSFRISQIIAETEQALLAAIDIPAGLARDMQLIGAVSGQYRAVDGSTYQMRPVAVNARFSANVSEQMASIGKIAARDVTILLAREANDEAVRLRDAGRVEESRRKFDDNVRSLDSQIHQYGLPSDTYLNQQRAISEKGASGSGDWDTTRKTIREIDSNQAGTSLRF